MDRKFTGVRARGDSIVLDFIYQGHRCRETLRVKPTKTSLKQASRMREAVLHDIGFGSFEYNKYFPDSKNAFKFSKNKSAMVTIEDILNTWMKRASQKCELSTLRDYRSALKTHLIPSFGKICLSDFNASYIYDWIETLNISNKRINNVLVPLRQALKEAFYDGLIDRNPIDNLRNLTPKTKEPEPFNRTEINQILGKLSGQEKNIFKFAFYSGLRTSELIGLRWEDVDLERSIVHVRIAIVRKNEKTTKTLSGQRTIDLSSESKQALQSQLEYTRNSVRVFHDPSTKKQWSGDHVLRKRVWVPALKAAGVKYRTPYQTRHTFASMLLSAGKNPMWVAQQMGHKDWGMIRKVYGRWINE